MCCRPQPSGLVKLEEGFQQDRDTGKKTQSQGNNDHTHFHVERGKMYRSEYNMHSFPSRKKVRRKGFFVVKDGVVNHMESFVAE